GHAQPPAGTAMSDSTGVTGGAEKTALMDELLRTGIPEIKLALGEVIDRENARPLPAKYARLLPPSTLVVILRADAAEALRPIAPALERELTDACNRHGSLYDRAYRVELQRTDQPDAPLYTVAIRSGAEAGESGSAGAGGAGEAAGTSAAGEATAAGGTAASPAGGAAERPVLPMADPDATRVDLGPPTGWVPGRW